MTCEEAAKLMDGYLMVELDPITTPNSRTSTAGVPNCDEIYKIHAR